VYKILNNKNRLMYRNHEEFTNHFSLKYLAMI